VTKTIIKRFSENPAVSIIIPSLYYKEREKNLQELLKDIEAQTFKDVEVILVIGDTRQGRAINTGVKLSRGTIIMTMDDDTRLGNNKIIENLYNALKENPSYGLVGAACEIPANASVFLKMILKQIPRRYFPVQNRDRESDMVQHPCLAIRKDLFLAIGGEDEELIRGLDPLLRYKVKAKGYKVVIIKDTWIYHLPPANLLPLIKMYYRNGRGSAFAKKFFPDKIYDVDSGYEENYIPKKSPFTFRIIRALLNLMQTSMEGKLLNLSVMVSYYTGYLVEYLWSKHKR
jgi:cellulose synthase/poly-beta-1,6-N-acetylglucosamine synthase-like glycosyltransferase